MAAPMITVGDMLMAYNGTFLVFFGYISRYTHTHAGRAVQCSAVQGSVCLLECIFIPISQVTVDKLNSLSISLSFDCFIISFHFVDV